MYTETCQWDFRDQKQWDGSEVHNWSTQHARGFDLLFGGGVCWWVLQIGSPTQPYPIKAAQIIGMGP